jgi:putative glycosyltransferase
MLNMTDHKGIELSIVTTMYRSENYVELFYQSMVESAQKLTDSFEIIYVNDGSPDRSVDVAVELHRKDNRVKVVDLSRNFGHHKAIMTGLSYCKGEYIFLIDCDLEEDPSVILEFWSHLMQEPNTDVVYGIQESRKGGWKERASGAAFYKVFNFLSSENISGNTAMARLMRRNYVDALVAHQERELFLVGLWAITGFNQKGLIIHKESSSPSTYTARKKIALMINAITAFSSKPLVYIFYLGSIISLLSFTFILYLAARKLFWNVGFQGWTSLIASIWTVGGIVIFSIGVVGIYISKIFIEVKNRPYTVVKYFHEQRPEKE